jgi:hypothetical protein
LYDWTPDYSANVRIFPNFLQCHANGRGFIAI